MKRHPILLAIAGALLLLTASAPARADWERGPHVWNQPGYHHSREHEHAWREWHRPYHDHDRPAPRYGYGYGGGYGYDDGYGW
jgi:hypothetical protein